MQSTKCHSSDKFYVVMKFQLPELNDISIIFRKMPVDYKNVIIHFHIIVQNMLILGNMLKMAKHFSSK